jgi:hypothetical protein
MELVNLAVQPLILAQATVDCGSGSGVLACTRDDDEGTTMTHRPLRRMRCLTDPVIPLFHGGSNALQ